MIFVELCTNAYWSLCIYVVGLIYTSNQTLCVDNFLKWKDKWMIGMRRFLGMVGSETCVDSFYKGKKLNKDIRII